MKTLGLFVLDIFACILLLVGSLIIKGAFGTPSATFAAAFTIGAHVLFLSAGFASSPRRGSYGPFRAVAFLVFFLAVIFLPSSIRDFAYNLKHAGNPAALLDPSEVIWELLSGSSGLICLIVGAWAWRDPPPSRANEKEKVGESK